MMNHDGIPIDRKNNPPVPNPQSIIRRKVPEPFHVVGASIRYAVNLLNHPLRNFRRQFPKMWHSRVSGDLSARDAACMLTEVTTPGEDRKVKIFANT